MKETRLIKLLAIAPLIVILGVEMATRPDLFHQILGIVQICAGIVYGFTQILALIYSK